MDKITKAVLPNLWLHCTKTSQIPLHRFFEEDEKSIADPAAVAAEGAMAADATCSCCKLEKT
jgi:hypothetical protein